ncbi:phospho-N-acetylmuramoyl-pentapeptide-transferase [Taibaiella sp. KBW10]|uniref:phospho-N-acetylmuramoyl-pentapeptide- transferase n=1 Tax=Taibaiella sp. KBW10 TaxID=2153357 RepID=UPI000F5A924A|nr:phospho-N-acetylmuramoyl-pentapeptide-transferase [Taibaiella sp. KBW10]RQO30461.1 phospho-N-acetylmuramoyl-pentapeptide-transferase [Taibaiella sp. KBW10]
MLYDLFIYLRKVFGMSGAGVFQFITFRASMAIILSLVITMIYGKKVIKYLQKKQIGETIRELGLEGQTSKKGTPTMGGIIIIAGILIPTLLFARITNVYILMMLISTIWLGIIGFLDDYIKVFKKNKEGLKGKFKVVGQIGLGVIIGSMMYFNSHVVTTREVVDGKPTVYNSAEKIIGEPTFRKENDGRIRKYVKVQSAVTSVPFNKNHEISFAKMASVFGEKNVDWVTPIIYILFVIFIITAVSNGANMTDGLDGLATGVSAIIGVCVGIFAYLSGNYVFAEYLNIMHIPNLGELSIFMAAFVGACIGFLWYNTYPAQVFMGDTGSLALGGIIACMAIIIRKELLIPIFCGIFLVENLSVLLQTGYFKYQKRKNGVEYAREHRLFKMAPLHHHYQKLGYHETKIVTRFWIIGLILAVLSIVSMKLQ